MDDSYLLSFLNEWDGPTVADMVPSVDIMPLATDVPCAFPLKTSSAPLKPIVNDRAFCSGYTATDSMVLDKPLKLYPSGSAGIMQIPPSAPPRRCISGSSAVVPSSPPPGGRRQLVADIDNPTEEEIQRLLSMRPSQLSEEERLVRKRAKNRQAAQNSRERKKKQAKSLESTVSDLAAENSNLTATVKQLSAEKQELVSEVAFLKRLISQSPELSNLYNSLKGNTSDIAAVVAISADDAGPSRKRRRME